MMQKAHEWVCFTYFLWQKEKYGLNSEEAAKEVGKIHAIYGDPDDTPRGSVEDRPLPWELKDRIVTYTERRFRQDPDNFKEDLKKASSFNALVRKEIRDGKI